MRLQNGWFVNSDGAVYTLINGSAYEVDATGTPLAKLKPGYYDEQLRPIANGGGKSHASSEASQG